MSRIRRLPPALRRTPMLAAAALLGLSGAAMAQPGAMFDKVDRNGDGAISREEAAAARTKAFERLDSNGDGVINREEIDARRERAQHRGDKMFSKADANGDGQISREEFMAHGGMMQRADSDGDGRVTREEAEAMRARIQSHRGQQP
ncbi:MAG: EF-hand domain-containing protein [Algiphilus sp.]